MRKKTQPKSSADVTESESSSSDVLPTTSQHHFNVSESYEVPASPEEQNSDDHDSENYQTSRKRKIVVQRQESHQSSNEKIDSDDSDNKCVFTIQHIILYICTVIQHTVYTILYSCMKMLVQLMYFAHCLQ